MSDLGDSSEAVPQRNAGPIHPSDQRERAQQSFRLLAYFRQDQKVVARSGARHSFADRIEGSEGGSNHLGELQQHPQDGAYSSICNANLSSPQ